MNTAVGTRRRRCRSTIRVLEKYRIGATRSTAAGASLGALVLMFTLTGCGDGSDAAIQETPPSIVNSASSMPTSPADPSTQGLQNLIWVRMVVYGKNDHSQWTVAGKYGDDVLSMIKMLQPDVLSRFYSGNPDPSIQVPMELNGRTEPMEQFLSDAMQAGTSTQSSGVSYSRITAKIGLNDPNTYAGQLTMAQNLINMPVTPKLQFLDLDTWFTDNDPSGDVQQIQNLKNVGWPYVGLNMVGLNIGGQKPIPYGAISYGYAGIGPNPTDSSDWQVNQSDIRYMVSNGIVTHLAHIDYPAAIVKFSALTPDNQAHAIQCLQRGQYNSSSPYTFVYPVLYAGQPGSGGYDSSASYTSSSGPYGGQSILQIIKTAIDYDRANHAPEPLPKSAAPCAA